MTGGTPRRATIVWLVLIAVTVTTFWLGTEHPFIGSGSRVAGGVALGGAFLKAFLVGQDFMEVRGAPATLQIVFGGWIVVFGSLTLTFLLI